MNPTFKVDMNEFQRTLKSLAATTSRSLPVFMNSRMLNVISEARRRTPVADRGKIMSDLGATLKSERTNAKGRKVRKYSYAPVPVVYKILNARRRAKGLPMLFNKDILPAAKSLIAARLRAVGSLRSGWTQAIGILAAVVNKVADKSGPRVKQPSTAKVARDGFNPTAEVTFRLTTQSSMSHQGQQIDPRAEDALRAGFAREHAEMISHLEKKVREAAQKAGAL
jgi:hypothetical protein